MFLYGQDVKVGMGLGIIKFYFIISLTSSLLFSTFCQYFWHNFPKIEFGVGDLRSEILSY